MRKRNAKAIFERQVLVEDHFAGETESWEEVCREYVSLEPLSGEERFQAAQVQALTTHKSNAPFSPTLATVNSTCRMKIAKSVMVHEDEPEHDDNYRIFGIESVINIGEVNRELEITSRERV